MLTPVAATLAVAAALLSLWSENRSIFFRDFSWHETGNVVTYRETDLGIYKGELVKFTNWGDCDFTRDSSALSHKSQTRFLMKRCEDSIRSQRWSHRFNESEGSLLQGEISSGYFDEAELPILLLAVLFALLPTFWFVRLLLRNATEAFKGKDGHCSKCDYDLRATPGRCPECGVVP